jgi:hypothetical protein
MDTNSLVLFAMHSPKSEIPYETDLYICALAQLPVSRIQVLTTNSEHKRNTSWPEKVELCVDRNEGCDFGLWFRALNKLRKSGIDKYQVLVLVNDSCLVTKPLLPMWEKMHTSPFWGVTDSFEVMHHIQSYFLCFRKHAISSLLEFMDTCREATTRQEVIQEREIALSQFMVSCGYDLDCAFDIKSCLFEQGQAVINPSFTLWNELQWLGCPLLKRKRHKMPLFGIIILQCAKHEKHAFLGKRCYQSVRNVYGRNVPILLIDDNSSVEVFRGADDPNCLFVSSEFPGAGEMLPYYYFYQLRPFQQALILHDSMIVREQILPTCQPIRFIWDFDSIIANDFNEIRPMVQSLPKNSDVALQVYDNVWLWKGCFGAASMIQHKTVVLLQEMFGFLNLVATIRTRPQRMAIERILGVLCSAIFGTVDIPTISGNIFSHPLPFIENSSLEDMLASEYNSPIVKTWHSR